MWKVEKFEESNVQLFYKNVNGKEELIYAPILLAKRYKIVDVLSSAGGFGVIYVALDTRILNRKILVKSRRYDNEPGLFMYDGDINRVKQIKAIRDEIEFEIECMQAFKKSGESRMPTLNDVVEDFCPSIYGPHKDVASGEEFFCTEDNVHETEPYIIMQYVEGESFMDYAVKRVEEINETEDEDEKAKLTKRWEADVIKFSREIATLLYSFHKKLPIKNSSKYISKYYIYQDLKPGNMIITEGNFLTLLDFGGMLEVRVDTEGNHCSYFDKRGKAGVSTFGYRAPEMELGSSELTRLDERSDIYSLGATIFSVLLGKDLVDVLSEDNTEIKVDVLRDMGYSKVTCDFIKKCTQYNKEDRFDTILTIKSSLYHVFEALKKGE